MNSNTTTKTTMTAGHLALIESCARECARPVDEHDVVPTLSDEMAVYDMIANYTRRFNGSQLEHVRAIALQCQSEQAGAMSVFERVRNSVTVIEPDDEDFFALI